MECIAAAGLGSAEGLFKRHRGPWSSDFCRRHGGLERKSQFETDDFIGQCRQTLRNIVQTLACAQAGPQHIVRLTWYVKDKHEYLARARELGTVYQEVIGRHYPVMALVQVADLVEDRAKVEIEATAVVPD